MSINTSHFRILHQGNPLSKAEVQALSDLYEYPFPDDYSDFLKQMNGCYLFSNFYDEDPANLFNFRGMVGVNEVLHFGYDAFYDTFGTGDHSDILKIRDRMRIDLPLRYLPLAYCAGGNYVFMDLKRTKIFFEDHEKLDLGESGLVHLADSFAEFVARITFDKVLN